MIMWLIRLFTNALSCLCGYFSFMPTMCLIKCLHAIGPPKLCILLLVALLECVSFGKNRFVLAYLVFHTFAHHLFDEMPKMASVLIFMFISTTFYFGGLLNFMLVACFFWFVCLLCRMSHVLEFVAQNTQRNKQKFLCKHSIHQPKIARLIKDQIFTFMKCAEID